MFVDAYGLTDRKAILLALQRCTLDEPEPLRWIQGMLRDLARSLLSNTAAQCGRTTTLSGSGETLPSQQWRT